MFCEVLKIELKYNEFHKKGSHIKVKLHVPLLPVTAVQLHVCDTLLSHDLQVMKMCRSAGLGWELQEKITQVQHTLYAQYP